MRFRCSSVLLLSSLAEEVPECAGVAAAPPAVGDNARPQKNRAEVMNFSSDMPWNPYKVCSACQSRNVLARFIRSLSSVRTDVCTTPTSVYVACTMLCLSLRVAHNPLTIISLAERPIVYAMLRRHGRWGSQLGGTTRRCSIIAITMSPLSTWTSPTTPPSCGPHSFLWWFQSRVGTAKAGVRVCFRSSFEARLFGLDSRSVGG
jgi:hypothetical protein